MRTTAALPKRDGFHQRSSLTLGFWQTLWLQHDVMLMIWTVCNAKSNPAHSLVFTYTAVLTTERHTCRREGQTELVWDQDRSWMSLAVLNIQSTPAWTLLFCPSLYLPTTLVILSLQSWHPPKRISGTHCYGMVLSKGVVKADLRLWAFYAFR